MAPKSKKPARSKETRAHALLTKVVATGWFDREEIARALVVTPRTLDAFVAGRVAMPLERQLCLALFVIDRLPTLARQGHQLKGQVAGAMAFQEREREKSGSRAGSGVRLPPGAGIDDKRANDTTESRAGPG